MSAFQPFGHIRSNAGVLRMPVAVLLLNCMRCAGAMTAGAADGAEEVSEERLAVHGQATYIEQETNCFNAPYSGPNSLAPCKGAETVDATLFLGVRPWRAGEIWVTPEIDQGFGLSNTLGAAGFPSGGAYKVGATQPYFRLPRAFLRQTIDIGGERETVEGVANQLRGSRTQNRWVITAGKFAVSDVFDTNQYAHDPRSDFLNWASVDTGTFDYAADAWGYTVGAAAELYRGSWTFRAGVFELSNVPNSEVLEHNFDEFQIDAEIEKRYTLFGQTGRALITIFDSRGRMGRYDHAIALAQATGSTPNTADVRQYRSRLGASLNLEQPITEDIGLFARIGKAEGDVEVYEFTDIDRSIAIGASITGAGWHRRDDVIGVAALDNRISGIFQEYLNLGGLGILVGDGKLPHPGPEQILETYYSFAALSWANITLNYQRVKNPAYNTDRGPVSVFAVRVHVQF
jgi:high affinity Mn2+ porin